MHGNSWLRFGVVAGGMFAACQFTHGYVRPDGGDQQPPDAGACTSLSTECVGDTLRYCTEIGGTAMDTPCGWGCVPGSAAHCAHVVPSGSGGVEMNGVTPADVDGTGLESATIGDGVTFDSDNGRIGTLAMPNLHHGPNTGIENGIDFQNRGPISVWRFKDLTINGTITIVGKRPVAFVSDGPVTIAGIVDARGICSSFVAGPGGFGGGSGSGQDGQSLSGTPGGGQGAPNGGTGGGGGGYGSIGGNGEATVGGMTWGDPEITTLVGGAGGGAGSGGTNFGRGGGGGGALQVVTNSAFAITSGGINAGGCGGKAGTGGNDSGGGGGAGGTILIEAPTVKILGTLAANGGGGGGGGGGNARPGANGSLDRMPAPGGLPDGEDEQGGDGAAALSGAGQGGTGPNGGGGGGGVGRIRLNTRNGSGADLTTATLSPGDGEMQFSTGSAAVR